MTSPFDIPLDDLRLRSSAKWRVFDPDVLPAWVAEMDFALAEPIQHALRDAVNRSDTGYMDIGELPQALADYASTTWSWSIEPAHVLVVPDVVTGIAAAIAAFTAPGDGVVINTPVYPPFFSTIDQVTRRRVVEVPMARDEVGAYRLDLEAIDAALAQPGVTALLLCSPHNPTGTVPTPQELDAVARIAHAHDALVIADEIHAPLTLPGVTHTPFLTRAGDGLKAVSVISASKSWNIPGLKCAQVVSASAEVDARLRESTSMETIYGTGLFGVLASIAAYREGQPWLDAARAVIAANVDRTAEVVREQLPLVRHVPPQATYLAWLDCTATPVAEDPAKALLEGARLAVTDGAGFGANGRGFIRLNLGTSPAILDEVLDRVVRVVGGA